jgi:hypothetical protein
MSMPLFLDSFAALLPSGMYSPKGRKPWMADQHGPDDVERSQVIDKPYPGFGKLPLSDKLAFGAASLMLSSCGVGSGQQCGISLSNATGSLSVDLRYWESALEGFPSPSLFSATLPSSPLTDIAIYFGLKGPNRVLAGGNASEMRGLIQAMTMLRCRKATEMLVISLSALEAGDRKSPLVPASLQSANRAYAFLITSHKIQGGLGLRINAQFDDAPKTLHDDSQADYFDTVISMLMEKRFGRTDFAPEPYGGFISIEKDA